MPPKKKQSKSIDIEPANIDLLAPKGRTTRSRDPKPIENTKKSKSDETETKSVEKPGRGRRPAA